MTAPAAPAHVPGLDLAEAFYAEEVAALAAGVPHGAALLGWGSDVLGFDTARSTDHGFGPRLQLFVAERDVARLAAAVDRGLPERFRGWPVRFGWDEVPLRHHVEVTTLGAWLLERLALDPRDGMRVADWLVTPQQALLEVTAGRVFHDGLGELGDVRRRLAWYPEDVWRWLLACQWRRISQEEAFVGRAAEAGDELGSRLVAATLVREVIRLFFLLERRYAPYAKWLGSAFVRLEAAREAAPLLAGALAAGAYQERESSLAAAYELAGRRHNALGVTAPVDPATRPYHGRPFRVLHAERFAAACLDALPDGELRRLPPVGAVDQAADSADVLAAPGIWPRLRALYA